ncbi:Metaxin-1 [Lamellibrachia satsuma]|nr:Metaxin-1 [Lamellibrachia satsuma]
MAGGDDARMQLRIWGGDWGIPSVDHKCLSVMAYCRFTTVPVKFVKTNNPWRSPTGELPILDSDGTTVTGVSHIFSFLRKQRWGTDYSLTARQCADILAFSALIEEKLMPALEYMWWVETKTYVDITRPWYVQALPFLLKFYLPTSRQRATENRARYCKGHELMTDSELENKLYKEAKKCMNLLSTKLGDNDYFFGSTPSSLDALVFGALAPLLKVPFPVVILRNHFKGCSNLWSLCQRILDKYFPLSPEEEDALKKKNEQRSKQTDILSDFPHKKRNMFIAGVVAVAAMVSYALLSGLVEIEILNDTEDKDNELSPGDLNESTTRPPDFSQFDGLFDDEDDAEGEGGDDGGED